MLPHTAWFVLLFMALLVHTSLSAVLIKRQSGFGKHKPQIWSGPYPCFDKDGVMKFSSKSTIFKRVRETKAQPRSQGPLSCTMVAAVHVPASLIRGMKREHPGNEPPPKDPPWFTDDKCHMSICAGAFVLTKSLCALKGVACPPGQYLAAVPKPSSPADCCVCKPYEPLK